MATSSISAEFRITDKTSAQSLVKVLTSSPKKHTKSKTKTVVLSQGEAINVFKARQNKQKQVECY